MSDHIPTTRNVSAAQIVGVMTFTLALFFMVAFATKSVESYQLRAWRDRLESDIAEMEREKQNLEEDLRRRQSVAWVDQVLRDSGRVPTDVVSVIAVPVQQEVPSAEADAGLPAAEPSRPVTSALSGMPFNNENWRAWQALIWGFDAE
jgi:hypothetical protein